MHQSQFECLAFNELNLRRQGDPNVPADQVTLIADLNWRLLLSEEQQRQLEPSTRCVPVEPDCVYPDEQAFVLPTDYHQRVVTVPPSCRARFCPFTGLCYCSSVVCGCLLAELWPLFSGRMLYARYPCVTYVHCIKTVQDRPLCIQKSNRNVGSRYRLVLFFNQCVSTPNPLKLGGVQFGRLKLAIPTPQWQQFVLSGTWKYSNYVSTEQ